MSFFNSSGIAKHAVADHKGQKKAFILFMMIGVFGSAALAYIPAGEWFTAAIVYGVGMMAFNISCVFYDGPSGRRSQRKT